MHRVSRSKDGFGMLDPLILGTVRRLGHLREHLDLLRKTAEHIHIDGHDQTPFIDRRLSAIQLLLPQHPGGDSQAWVLSHLHATSAIMRPHESPAEREGKGMHQCAEREIQQ